MFVACPKLMAATLWLLVMLKGEICVLVTGVSILPTCCHCAQGGGWWNAGQGSCIQDGGTFPSLQLLPQREQGNRDSTGSDWGGGGGGGKKCLVWCEGLAWLGTGSQAEQDMVGGGVGSWFQVPNNDLNEKSITGPIGKNELTWHTAVLSGFSGPVC